MAADTPQTDATTEWCDQLFRAIEAVENAGEALRGLAHTRPPGSDPSAKLAALLSLWDDLGMDGTSRDPLAARAALMANRRGRERDLKEPAAEALGQLDRAIVACVKAGGQAAADPVVSVADFPDNAVFVVTLTGARGNQQTLAAVSWVDVPPGHPLRQALTEANLYDMQPPNRYSGRLAVLLGPRLEDTVSGGKRPCGWCRVSQAVRYTRFWKADQDERIAKKVEDEAARREWRERERAADPAEKARRMEAEIARLKAEVDRLKEGQAAAGQGAPS